MTMSNLDICRVFIFIGLMAMAGNCEKAHGDFRQDQLRYPRVRDAYTLTEASLKKAFAEADIPYPPSRIFIQIFKQEKLLELWIFNPYTNAYHLFRNYKICRSSGKPGPKRRMGDFQVPEGFYQITRFNPASSYYLSLGINYPNESDRILSDPVHPGGDIFIHGNCVTIGCVPITDEKIKEVYVLAVEAKTQNAGKIPVWIFPCKMDGGSYQKLLDSVPTDTDLIAFWENLRIGYDMFKKDHKLPAYRINPNGVYVFSE